MVNLPQSIQADSPSYPWHKKMNCLTTYRASTSMRLLLRASEVLAKEAFQRMDSSMRTARILAGTAPN